MKRTHVLAAAVAVAVASSIVPPSPTSARPPEATIDSVYRYANGCYALQDAWSGRFVVRDVLGYGTTAGAVGSATPFRMQATALGRYLFYGTGGEMISAGPLDTALATTTPGPDGDWAA